MGSRNRRVRGEQADNPFVMDAETPTFESVDRQGYGGPLLAKLDKHITAKPIPLSEIEPDPSQPRRTVPFVVRQVWDGNIETLFETWFNVVETERGDSGFDLKILFTPEEDEVRNHAPLPVESALLGLVDLAASILRSGLTNPITVVRDEDKYRLETGERRWLAYHLLYFHTQDEQWAKIPARVMDTFSLWRQAGENNARDNLNAIGKTRQLALLIMDLYRQQGTLFQPYEKLVKRNGCDREFYAQVEDSGRWRIPHGKAELLLNATGLKSLRQLSQYRALLSLPDKAWMIADDTNLSEYRLRQILDMKLNGLATTAAIQQAAQEFGDNSGTVVPLEQENQPPTKQRSSRTETISLLNTDDQKQIRQFLSFARTVRLDDIPKLDSNRKQQVLTWARALKALAEKVEQAAASETEP
ncbi:MAG: ParB/RepB/Spo0J family partition protein [Anaerolineae bacterium]|nr:ParB/RepB/Spo0J family partition protein [Anaerolineae bacterium]